MAPPIIDPDFLIAVGKIMRTTIRLRILILGPGRTGGDIYVKRCQIRDIMTQLGHEAHFCEELLTPDLLQRSGLNLGVAEYVQALTYDYIICLMASPGSVGEVHDFARNKKMAAKMMICVDGKHKGGYSAQSVIRIFESYNGKIDWFDYPADITHCHLASRVVEHIEKIAERKQWELATQVGSP